MIDIELDHMPETQLQERISDIWYEEHETSEEVLLAHVTTSLLSSIQFAERNEIISEEVSSYLKSIVLND